MSHRRIQGGKLNFRGAKKIKFRALYASEARTIGKKTNGLKSYSLNYISLGPRKRESKFQNFTVRI